MGFDSSKKCSIMWFFFADYNMYVLASLMQESSATRCLNLNSQIIINLKKKEKIV